MSRKNFGDVPQELRDEKIGPIVGTGGPRANQFAKSIKVLNNTVFVNSGHSIQTESQQVLPANGGRNYLLIQNNSGADIRASFGNKADLFNGVLISSGGYYEPFVVPSSSINLLGTAADSAVVVVEGYGVQI